MSTSTLFWLTRGLKWGFRILHAPGGDYNWIKIRDEVFARSTNDANFFVRGKLRAGREPYIAGCFLDPEMRKDSAGRVIPHEIILFEPSHDAPQTAEQLRDLVWPSLKDEYARDYGKEAAEMERLPVVIHGTLKAEQRPSPLVSPRPPGVGNVWPFVLLALVAGAGAGFIVAQLMKYGQDSALSRDDASTRVGAILAKLDSVDRFFSEHPDRIAAVAKLLDKSSANLTREELNAVLIYLKSVDGKDHKGAGRGSPAH